MNHTTDGQEQRKKTTDKIEGNNYPNRKPLSTRCGQEEEGHGRWAQANFSCVAVGRRIRKRLLGFVKQALSGHLWDENNYCVSSIIFSKEKVQR